MVEHELGRVEQGPDEVFVRLGVCGRFGNDGEEAGAFVVGRFSGEAADEEFFDGGGGRRLVFDVGL